MVEIVPYEPEMAPALTALYNRGMLGVPHCYPAAVEVVSACLSGGTEAQRKMPLQARQVLVALDGASVKGFVHLGIGRERHRDTEEKGILRFLWAGPGYRVAGRALLEAAEEVLRKRGMQQIAAFPQAHRYPFYHLPYAYLSDRLWHIGALLAMAGYQTTQGEVFLGWRDYPAIELTPTSMPTKVTVHWRGEEGKRPGVAVCADQGERRVGICCCAPLANWTDVPETQDWCFVDWVCVEEDVQGQGLGKHLLQRALVEMREAGFRHTAISTDWRNYQAALFYTNLGYQVLDWTHGYERDLASRPGGSPSQTRGLRSSYG